MGKSHYSNSETRCDVGPCDLIDSMRPGGIATKWPGVRIPGPEAAKP
jgi:hypothetical protein